MARHVKNQFNITDSVIGQLAVGNKGPTVFNNKTERFEAGSTNSEYKISGGNFTQANVGGEAHYNNKNSSIGTVDKDGRPGVGGAGTGLTIEKLGYRGSGEDTVLRILRSGIDAERLKTILRKGIALSQMDQALTNAPDPEVMIDSMMQADAMDTDSD